MFFNNKMRQQQQGRKNHVFTVFFSSFSIIYICNIFSSMTNVPNLT